MLFRSLRHLLTACRTIAVVGLSPQWHRPSYFAAKYMQAHGYRIVPVNPLVAQGGGQIINVCSGAGEKDPPVAANQGGWGFAYGASKAALDAQKHLDAITLGRGPQKPVQVSVSVTADAAFASAWGVVRRILDARHPGAAEDCETALACWEDGGDERVAEWLEETAPPAGATTH